MEFRSINKIYENSFRENWDRPALSNYQGVTLTYGEMSQRIALIHVCFEGCGLSRGDKVAICSRNQSNWAVSFLAALTYGAVPVPILHEFKPGNIHYLVNHSEAKVLFVDDVVWEGLSEVEMPGLSAVVQMNTLKYLYVKDEHIQAVRDTMNEVFNSRYPDGYGPDDIVYYKDKPDDLALINYTSGTSGFSKGVMIPYRALYANIHFAGEFAEPQLNCYSEVVAMLPSAHMYGLLYECLFEMTIGAHVHFLTRTPSPKVILKAFADIKPDIIIAVPLIIEKVYKTQIKPLVDNKKTYMKLPLLNQVIRKRIRNGMIEAFGGHFEEVIMGGAGLNPEVERFLNWIKFPFTVGYGMTECAPIITYSKWYKCKLGSCGKAIPNCQIRIDSDDPVNVPGEVQVKGPNVFLGYYKNEKATEEAFTDDGWFRTGDMGVMDTDGYLYLKGRCKCMILGSSGQNIYPEELEAVVNNVNYVADSLVIEDSGKLVALVYPDYHQASLDGMTPDQIKARLEASLPEINAEIPNYARIAKMEFLPEDFERTPKKSIKRYLYKRD